MHSLLNSRLTENLGTRGVARHTYTETAGLEGELRRNQQNRNSLTSLPYSIKYLNMVATLHGKRRFKNEVYGQLGRIGKALASPKRLELLDLICQAERSVEELAN